MTIAERSFLGRAAAVAILLVLLAAVWIGPGDAYFGGLAAGAERIDAKTALLQRYRSLTETGAATDTAPSGPSMLLPDIPDAQAAAVLQETVKGAATAAQIQIRGLQVLRPQPASGSVRIGIRISASGDIANISRLLHAIEAARPVLYPDNLQLRAGAPTPGAAPAPLEFQVDISGFKAGAS